MAQRFIGQITGLFFEKALAVEGADVESRSAWQFLIPLLPKLPHFFIAGEVAMVGLGESLTNLFDLPFGRASL